MPKLIRDSLPENPEEQIENEPETPFVPESNIFMREWRVFVGTDSGVMQLYRFTEHIEVDIKTKRDKIVQQCNIIDEKTYYPKKATCMLQIQEGAQNLLWQAKSS